MTAVAREVFARDQERFSARTAAFTALLRPPAAVAGAGDRVTGPGDGTSGVDQ